MATPFREYPELNGADTPDIPYRVNGALRAIDQDVSGLSDRIAGVETLGGLKAGSATDAAMTVVANNRQSLFAKSMRAILDNAFVGSIRAQVGVALGSNDAPARAAGAAVDAAAKQADILTGNDVRTPVPLEANSGWSHPFTDALGRVVGGFTAGGKFRLAQPMDAPKLLASRTQLACIGDSLVRGYTGSQAWPVEDAWPAHLAKLLPGVEVTNAGYGGNTVDDVRFRIGAMRLYVEIEGGIIPGAGPVKAVMRQRFGLVESRQNAYYGTLAGVTGSLDRTPAGDWTFTRSAAGAPVPAPGKQLLAREDFYPNHTALIWVGRNDVSYDAKGREADLVEHVVSSIEALVEHLAPDEKQFCVVSILNRVDEPAGSERHRTVVAINDALAVRFPGRFLNLRPWLVSQAIYDAGLTPTAADLKAIAADSPPPQIMDGGSHYIKEIAPLLAGKFAEYLTEKGYC